MKPPDWLKTAVFVCHAPDKTVFTPERRITFKGERPCLIDPQENFYPLADCEPFKLEHLNGVILLVTENSSLTLYRDPNLKHRLGNGFVVSDGIRRAGVMIPDDIDLAARDLARDFAGVIVPFEEIGDLSFGS